MRFARLGHVSRITGVGERRREPLEFARALTHSSCVQTCEASVYPHTRAHEVVRICLSRIQCVFVCVDMDVGMCVMVGEGLCGDEGLILESVDSTNGIIRPDRKLDSNACFPL